VDAGWSPEQLHQEAFAVDTEAAAALVQGDEVTVRVASSGVARSAELTLDL
jgi:hypothetical protein